MGQVSSLLLLPEACVLLAVTVTGGPGERPPWPAVVQEARANQLIQSVGTRCDRDSYQGLRPPAGAGLLLAVTVRPSFCCKTSGAPAGGERATGTAVGTGTWGLGGSHPATKPEMNAHLVLSMREELQQKNALSWGC